MDVQKLSAPSAASVGPAPRPATRPAVDGGSASGDATSIRLSQIEHSLADAFPPQLKLQLDIDRTTNTVVGKVVDRATGEFVRQIPSKEMLALLARSAQVNALINKKV
jgi:flagellar protein FlaG